MSDLIDGPELDLRSLHSDTNIQKTELELTAEKDSYLTLDETSSLVNSSINYASKGGGDIAVKVATIGRQLHTGQSVKDFDMEEKLIKSADWEAIDKVFKNILI